MDYSKENKLKKIKQHTAQSAIALVTAAVLLTGNTMVQKHEKKAEKTAS